jgi:ribose/xylose/arabinose/galactoside ABC-type transport system permease subunit
MAPQTSADRVRRALVRYGLFVALAVVAAALSAAQPNFLSAQNLLIVLRQISINGILAVGVTYVLLTGGVDLSLGSLVALSGVIAAGFAHPAAGPGLQGQYPLVVPVMMGVLAGATCGVASGLVVTLGRVAPFIVTLGMMTIARGLALVLSGGKPVSNLTPAFGVIGGGDILYVPVPVWILAGVALVSWLFLSRTRHGRYLYAVGGNEEAARASGLHVGRIKVLAYALCGGLAGLGGVILASRITTGQPNAGVAYELDAIAAAVIGGTSLSGGVGSVGGTLLGALLMGVINNGLDLLDVPSYYQQIVKGLIIVGAVWMDRKGAR